MADLETRQVNSLYKRINNEAVDEDKRANRRAIEFYKKQAKLFSPDVKQAKVLSKKDLDNLKKLVSKFSTLLNKYTVSYAKYNAEDEIKDITNIQGQYDIICLFLAGIGLSSLDKPDYNRVINELDKLIPKLGEVRRLIYAIQGELDETIYEKQVIDHIYNNFRSNTYYPFGSYTNEDIVEVGRLIGEERARLAREQVEAGMENVQPEEEEQELPNEVRQLPIGIPIPDQDVLDQFEEYKRTLEDYFDELNDYANVSPAPVRRLINIRLRLIEQNLITINNILDGRIEPSQEILDLVNQTIDNVETFLQTFEQYNQ